MMELKELSNFLKVAEYENITKAAQDLHVAQPHLTRQIQNLEQELGVALFIREKKRLHITDEGLFLKQQAEQILGLAQKTKEQISEMESGISGTLYIGSIETVGTIYLPQWISGFKNCYPKIRYNLWSGNSMDVIERLERGLIDLALVRAPFDKTKFDSFPVLDEKWIVLMNKEHPIANNGRVDVSLEELAKEELLVPTQRINEVGEWFKNKGLQSNIICGFSPLMNAIVMAQNNLGIAILPDSCKQMLFKDQVIIKDLSENMMSTVSFIWRKQYELPSTAKRFLDFVKENPVHTKSV